LWYAIIILSVLENILSDLKYLHLGQKLDCVNEVISWNEIDRLIHELASKLTRTGIKFAEVVGIANGGIVPARLIARDLDIDSIRFIHLRSGKIIKNKSLTLEKKTKYLIVDDILDTGNTYRRLSEYVRGYDCAFAFCVSRSFWPEVYAGKVLKHKKWVVFPWEKNTYENKNNNHY
jgi:uncharacterized protein